MSRLSTSQYAVALGYLKQQVDALEPAQLTLQVESNFSNIEADRQRVLRAVSDLKSTLADAYAAAQRAQANGV